MLTFIFTATAAITAAVRCFPLFSVFVSLITVLLVLRLALSALAVPVLVFVLPLGFALLMVLAALLRFLHDVPLHCEMDGPSDCSKAVQNRLSSFLSTH